MLHSSLVHVHHHVGIVHTNICQQPLHPAKIQVNLPKRIKLKGLKLGFKKRPKSEPLGCVYNKSLQFSNQNLGPIFDPAKPNQIIQHLI